MWNHNVTWKNHMHINVLICLNIMYLIITIKFKFVIFPEDEEI